MAGESQKEPVTPPDPTTVTTENILREVEHLRELVMIRIDGFEARVDERYAQHMGATDKEFEALKESLRVQVADADKAIDKALETTEKALDRRQVQLDKEFHEHLVEVRHENALAFLNADKATASALAAQKEAVNKAEQANEKRFAAVNEFRAQLQDQAATFLTKAEYGAAHQNVVDRVGELTDRINRSEGRSGGYTAVYGWGIGAIGLLISVIILVNSLYSN